jgi:TetR/AcrR family transcriptional regulator, repressor for uid operon
LENFDRVAVFDLTANVRSHILRMNVRSFGLAMILDNNHIAVSANNGDAPFDKGVRAEKRGAQVSRIMDAARNCFVQSGFRGASMHEICRKADMSPGALYRYFPSKESIIEAIAEQDRQADQMILSTMVEGPTLLDGFIRAAMAHFSMVRERGMAPLFTEIRAESMRNETVRNACKKNESQITDAFHAFLSYGVARGDIEPVEDIDTLVHFMLAIGEGIIMSDLAEKGVSLSKIETILRAMATAVLRPKQTAPNAQSGS